MPGERGGEGEGEGESGGQGEGREEGRKGGKGRRGSESDCKEEFKIKEEREGRKKWTGGWCYVNTTSAMPTGNCSSMEISESS